MLIVPNRAVFGPKEVMTDFITSAAKLTPTKNKATDLGINLGITYDDIQAAFQDYPRDIKSASRQVSVVYFPIMSISQFQNT